MDQKKHKSKGYIRMSYSDYCQSRHQRIPDFEIWKQNEDHKLKIFSIIRDFDPLNIRDTDILIFKIYFKQVECVQRIKKELNECLNQLFKLEIFIQQQLERNTYGKDYEFSYLNFNLEINDKLEYIGSINDQEIQSYFNTHKDKAIYKSYMESNTKIMEKEKNMGERGTNSQRTQWQFYNPFAYIIPEMNQFLNDIEEDAKIQSKSDKVIKLTKQGYQSYKDGNYDDAVKKFDASLICNPQLSYAYLGKGNFINKPKRFPYHKFNKVMNVGINKKQSKHLTKQQNLNQRILNSIKQIDILSQQQNEKQVFCFNFDMIESFSQQQQQNYYQFQQLIGIKFLN
ncbi:hypothetical protein pb186bvf_020754 [Paramecium bursaria]